MEESSRKREGEAGVSAPEATGFHGIDETSPDMLKNTPSNIMRLADEIHQCEGRQKYLTQTRSPSDGGDVRWYFRKVPSTDNELAASVPSTEIVRKGDYFRFGMRDSLAIEASFLQREEELLSCWWKEYAECSEGPKARPSSDAKVSPESKASSLMRQQSFYVLEEERVGVPVKGGLYEVDLVKRHCFPVYWNGENRRVLRGHWFARKWGRDWLPLREDVSEQLEFAYRSKVWHRRSFQPSGLFAARVDLQGSTQGLHALFTGEDDTWEACLNIDASCFSAVISFGGNGIMLRRGYAASHSSKPTQDELCQLKEEEMDDYCSQVPVQHLVFMVHGIGQRLENSSLVDDVTNFRIITAKLAERHLTSYQRGTQRVLFIPCQWRKGLKLSSEATIEKITLDGVRGLRMTLSATVLDVLYYMSPIYCQDIINSVSDHLNRLYLKFLKRNPGYDGKVSLFGHSLGSVLSYDIICHQENLSSPFPMEWMYKEQHPMNEESSSPTLNNQSSEYNSKSSQNNNVVSINNRTKGIVGPSEEGNAGGKTTFPVPEMEDSSVPAGFSVPLDFDEPSAMEVESKQPDAISSLGKDDNEQIDCLKARIAELETLCGGAGVEVVSTTTANQPVSGKLPCGQNDTLNCLTPYIKYTKLEFTVDTFFAVGSPLGVFLALRNTCIGIGKGQKYWEEENVSEEMPACRQMFNIFHPFDPVAYRLEPLICKEYISKRPVIVPYHRGGKRLHIGLQEFAEDFALRSQAIMDQLGSVRVKLLTLCQSRDKDNLDEASEDNLDKLERSYGSIMMERLTGSEDGRVDHMLQHKTFQHPYISAIGSHTNYWRDDDTALFILKHLYRDIPEEPELLAGKNLAAKRMITGQKVGQTKERLWRKKFL